MLVLVWIQRKCADTRLNRSIIFNDWWHQPERPHIKNANEFFTLRTCQIQLASHLLFFCFSVPKGLRSICKYLSRCFIQPNGLTILLIVCILAQYCIEEYFHEEKNLWTNRLKFSIGFHDIWSLLCFWSSTCVQCDHSNIAIIQTNREVKLAAIIDRDNRKRFFAIS